MAGRWLEEAAIFRGRVYVFVGEGRRLWKAGDGVQMAQIDSCFIAEHPGGNRLSTAFSVGTDCFSPSMAVLYVWQS